MRPRLDRRRRRGVSGIIAGLIVFVILFTVGTGYFLWVNTNNQMYIQALANRNNDIQAQQGESLSLTAFVATTDGGYLMFTPTDTGSEPVAIASVLVTDTTGVPVTGGQAYALDLVLNSGEQGAAQQTNVVYCPSSGCMDEPLVIKAVTQRGSVFSVTYYPPAITTASFRPHLPQGSPRSTRRPSRGSRATREGQ